MIIRVEPSSLSGTIKAPASKSVMQRLIAGGILSNGVSKIYNLSNSDDCTAALNMAAQLGATIELGDDAIAIHGMAGGVSPRNSTLHPGESGLGARLFAPIAGLSSATLRMNASGSLAGRPMQEFVSAFHQWGGLLKTNEGSFPIEISEPLKGGLLELDGSMSSQFLSGLLMVMPVLPNACEIRVSNPVSKPYIQLTLDILEDFGISIAYDETLTLFKSQPLQCYNPLETTVDGDWSGAAFIAVAGMLRAEQSIEIDGLDNQYEQADEAIRGALLFAGGALSGTDSGLQIARRPVRNFQMDLTDCPDLFPPLVALASFAKKPSLLKGVHRLQHKESNRAEVLRQEWGKLGVQLRVDANLDTIEIIPPKMRPNGMVRMDAHGDHRIAMAAAIMGIAGDAPVEIIGAECVSKSYPEFFDDLETLGGRVKLMA